MSCPLFNFPTQAAFNRVLPKSKLYKYAKPNSAVREKFITQVDKIIWQYKLASETINLPARLGVSEIQIFLISLKMPELDEDVLRCIDQVIPFPIFYQLTFEDRIKTIVAYKRPNESSAAKWVVDLYFETPWQPIDTERTMLPIALDLGGLYEQMLRLYIPLPPRLGESLKAQVERLGQIRAKQNEYHKVEIRLQKEKQFNHKVELNAQLRRLKKELEILFS
jgi:hypothetical protein